jgi:hypothetical protein
MLNIIHQTTGIALCISENHEVIMLQHIRNLSSKVGNTPLAFVHYASVQSFEAQVACKQTLMKGQPRDIAPRTDFIGFVTPLYA